MLEPILVCVYISTKSLFAKRKLTCQQSFSDKNISNLRKILTGDQTIPRVPNQMVIENGSLSVFLIAECL